MFVAREQPGRSLQILRLYSEGRFPDTHAKEPRRNGLQPREGQGLRLAQVGPLQPPIPRAIGSPVRPPAPVACPFFVCGEAAMLTAKGKGGGSLEPAIPIGRIHHQLSGLAVQLVGEDAILDDWRGLSHRSLALLPSATEQGFPNSIAHVRESLFDATQCLGSRCPSCLCFRDERAMGTLPFVSADEIHNPVQTKVKSDLKRGFRSIEVRCKANLPMMCHLSDKKYRF